jgi:hypothetical protein
MRANVARPEVVQVGAERRWPLGCVMRKPSRFIRGVARGTYIHPQGPRNRYGWIGQVAGLLLRCCRPQAILWADQQVGGDIFRFDSGVY